MAVKLFLITAVLSATGSTAYLLLKLLSAAGGDRLSQNWRYRGAMTVSLLFVLPFYKMWALFPDRPRILAPGGVPNRIPSASAAASGLPAQAGGGAVDWALVVHWAAALWLLISAGLIAGHVWRLLRYRRMIERAGSEARGRLRRIAPEAARLAGVSGEVRLLTSPSVQSPLLVGFFRPVVALPPEHLPNRDARLILTHELTHFRRGDLWKKLLVSMVQCVHWFNPAVYLLSRDFAYWQETSCDERVVESLDRAQRKEYGYLLINYAPTSRRAALYVSFAPCRYKLKRRITTMMKSNIKYRPVLSRVLALALAAGCVTATSAFAAPRLPEVESEKPVSVSWDVISEGKYQVKIGVVEVVENDAGNGDGTKVVIRLIDGDDGQTYAYYPADMVEELGFEYVTAVDAAVLENAQSMTTTLVSVSHMDESRFTPEKWAEILKMIDEGRVFWEDP